MAHDVPFTLSRNDEEEVWQRTIPVYSFPREAFFERLTQLHSYPGLYSLNDLRGPSRVPKRILRPKWLNPFTPERIAMLANLQQGSVEWRDARNDFLSSSRFGVIAAEHPQAWETPLEFWRESTGRKPPKVYGPRALGFMAHGIKYEPVARSVYERYTGCGTLREEGTRVEMREPYIYSASPDGVGEGQLIEIKCRAIGSLYPEVPFYYLPQIVGAAVIYDKPFSDFVGYWARSNHIERFMICCRVYVSELYWQRLRMRLDYMAWCIVNDVPPTGMLVLKDMYPLPPLRIEDCFFYEGRAETDDDPNAPIVNLF